MAEEGVPRSGKLVAVSHPEAWPGGAKAVGSRNDRQKSRQGRPIVKEGSNGREQLLERTREALRAKPKADLQRQQIAEIAGVTPALVSYYFPDKWDLIEESASTQIDLYFARMQVITSQSQPGIKELRRLVELYVDFSIENGYTLDFFMQNINSWKRSDCLEKTLKNYESLMKFFKEMILSGVIKHIDPAVLNSVLWSSSHYLAQQYISRPDAFYDGSTYTVNSIAESILQLVLYGLINPDGHGSSLPR